MQLLLKNDPLLDIRENGTCTILEFDRLPFALRKENLAFVDFMEWASNRTLYHLCQGDPGHAPIVSDQPVCRMQGMQGAESGGRLLDPAEWG